jgi:hypothetical protein
MRACSLRLLIFVFFVLAAAMLVLGANNDLQCLFISGTSCPGNSTKIMGVQNDSGGFQNAHAQNWTNNTYAYSVCCNTTGNSTLTFNNSCKQASIVNMSAQSNAHIEIGSGSNYAVGVCLNSSWQRVYCSYEAASSCSTYTCLFSMAGSEGINTTNAHIGNCSQYYEKVCCGLANNAPLMPSLIYPSPGNTSVFERLINFTWSNVSATEPEGDAVVYTLNVTCTDCVASCSTNVNVASISSTNYTISTPLCPGNLYNWTVSACDTYGTCNTSNISNFTMANTADFVLLINATNFGTMTIGDNNDTTDFSPTPLVGYNNGNVKINVTVNATQLFTSQGMGTIYFMYKAEDNESGSLGACSKTTFANMDTTPNTMFCNLSYISYANSANTGNIQINVTAPLNEPPGGKSSIVQFNVVKSE